MDNRLISQFKALTRAKRLAECRRWAEQLRQWEDMPIGMCPVPKEGIFILKQLARGLERCKLAKEV